MVFALPLKDNAAIFYHVRFLCVLSKHVHAEVGTHAF